MQIRAAIVAEKGGVFQIETVELAEPAADEVIVRVVASGVCQTDVHGRDAYYGTPFPCVFGHEGAGVVERVGSAVRKVRPGDPVIMVSPGCGACGPCGAKLPGYCVHARRIKFSGLLRSGAAPLRRGSEAVHGAFFQQSSFATHSLALESNVVKVPAHLPLEQLAAFPCGVNTGAGAVMNVLRPRAGQSFVVFGAGSVGLAGLMAAKLAGCAPIVAVDLHAGRLALARELGATHAIDARSEDVVVRIKALTGGLGADHVLEAAGDPRAFRQAVDALALVGTCCLAGSARPGTEVTFEMFQIQNGRTVRGCIQGDSDPDAFFPRLFALFEAGKLPVDRLITYYDFADIDRAAADMVGGRTVKAVLRMPSGPGT
jgi:aryl-alcohol dehydrogenase